MTVGSLFSGIGGLDLGLERAGMEIRWQVEIDEFCRKVLEKHWPDVKRYGDIRELNGDELEPIDLICGGFPCQPVSLAGKRRGQEDERWLWPEMARIIRVVRPRYVLVENVPGLLVRGMGDVLGDLAACGYDAEWQVLPAAAFGAPHIRERVFIVAHPDADGRGRQKLTERNSAAVPNSTNGDTQGDDVDGLCDDVADANAVRWDERTWLLGAAQRAEFKDCGETVADTKRERLQRHSGQRIFQPSEFAAFCESARRFWESEPDVGRVAHGVPNRVDRLRALGNAVVPQVAEWIGRRIMEAKRRKEA